MQYILQTILENGKLSSIENRLTSHFKKSLDPIRMCQAGHAHTDTILTFIQAYRCENMLATGQATDECNGQTD
jgi:hypothetical protein